MIDIKKAVNSSRKYLKELYRDDELKDIALEEVEKSEDEKYWFVTLGFTQNLSEPLNPMEAMTGPKSTRVFKVFKIDAANGEVLSMKIRKI